MKKRVLSAFMALALCLTLLPAPARAEGTEGGAAQIGNTVYSTLPEAVNAAQDGDTIKLLADYKTAEGAGEEEESGLTITKSVTLDLNGYGMDDFSVAQVNDAGETLPSGNLTVEDTSAEKAGKVTGMIELLAGKLTINGGTIGDGRDGVSIENGNLIVNGGTIDFLYGSNSGTVTITGGTVKNARFGEDFNITVTGGSGHTGLWDVSEGTWNISGGAFEGVTFLTGSSASNAPISGGTFGKITGQILRNGEVAPAPLSGLLADGYAFYEQAAGSEEYDRCVRLDDMITSLESVQVKPHTHNFTGNNTGCTECGKEFAASVTQNGAVTYYEDFAAALSAANAGDTLTLLNTVRSDATLVAIHKAIILDLNGHNIQGFGVHAKATIKDSSESKGTIGTLGVFGNGLTLGDLLEPGYAFRTTNAWCIGTKEEEVVANVTVQQAPITSVTLTALNADNTAASTSMPYGTTGGIKLSASCEAKPGVTELSCQWYTIGDSAVLIPEATGPVYQLPTNLSVGEHKYRVTFTADGYSKSADITITVEKIDLANAEVTISDWPTDGKVSFVPSSSAVSVLIIFDNSVSNRITVKANGTEGVLTDRDYTYDGATATQVGKYTLTITATDSCENHTGSKTFDWEVVPYALPAPVFEGKQTYTKTYDGNTTLPEGYKFQALFLAKEPGSSEVDWRKDEKNYEVTSAEFVSPDAGENKPINQTITLKNENFVFEPTEKIKVEGITTTDRTITYKNFTLSEAYPTLGTTFNIKKATVPDVDNAVTLDIVNNLAHTYTIALPALPALESPRTYGEITYGQPAVQLDSGYYTVGNAKVENGKLILTINKNPVTTTGSIGTVTVKVTTTNYKDVTLTVNLKAVNQRKLGMFVSVATDPVVYGMTLGDIKLSAEATDGGQVIPGTIAWEDPLTTVPAAGRATYRWTFTPDDTMHYLTASNTIHFSVDKATPTGAPTYTAITTGGKTLADAALTANASWPSGTVQWVDKDGKPLPASTQVQANTEYTWSFTPADADNYNGATGSVTLYAVTSGGGSSSGGSSSSASKTSTTTNADGSVTKTEIKADGTVVETTTGKDGSVSKTESKPDGSSVTETKAADGSTGTVKTDKNGQTTAETTLSSKAIEDAKKNGEAVTAPVEVKATRNSSTAPTVSIELPKGAGETKVEIPVSNVTSGTVAVLVHPDGTEEILKDSVPTEDGIRLTVDGNATVKIVDNSKDFIDTQDHWAKDAIDFVSARGLVNGMSATIYAPNNSTTRAQLWTILARQNDADLNGGNTWFENAQSWAKAKGVSDGTNPNGTINRAQMVTMLWRTMGQPAAGGAANFTDVSADAYYASAVSWAVEHGITTGIGGGRFDPAATCTRAQIATFLARSMK